MLKASKAQRTSSSFVNIKLRREEHKEKINARYLNISALNILSINKTFAFSITNVYFRSAYEGFTGENRVIKTDILKTEVG